MKKSQYQFIFSFFNLLAVAIIVSFTAFVLYQLKSILFKSRSGDAKVLPVKNFEKGNSKFAKPLAPTKARQGDIHIGKQDLDKIKSTFQWPEEEGLIEEALQLFRQKSNWSACLYLESIQSHDKQSKEQIMNYINNFYQLTMARALVSELDKMGYPIDGEKLDLNKLFKKIQFNKGLVLINNLYVYLRKHEVPEEIADIMIQFMLSQINDPFLKMVSRDMLAKKSQEYTDYLNAETFADNCLKTKDKLYLEMYMWQCLIELWRSWSNSDKATKKWILGFKTNVDERAYMDKLIKDNSLFLKQKEYLRLSQFHRFLLAKYAFSNINNEKQESFFNNYIYWSEDVIDDHDHYKNLARYLRHNPRWNALINQQKYQLAVKTLLRDYKVMTLSSMPAPLRKRIIRMAALEKKIWFENVNDEVWRSMLLAKTKRGERNFTKKIFWKTLYAIFPQQDRTNEQKVLIAACLINRGFNPKVFVNLGIDNNLLKKYFPAEELNAK